MELKTYGNKTTKSNKFFKKLQFKRKQDELAKEYLNLRVW